MKNPVNRTLIAEIKRFWQLRNPGRIPITGLKRSLNTARWAAVFAFTLVLNGGCGLNAPSEPNFVFILVDDLGYMDIGANNPSTFYETPSIDKLASEGMRLTQAYAAAPVCSPTRASIMTGKYPGRIQTTDYFGAPQPDGLAEKYAERFLMYPAPYIGQLPSEEKTIAELLKESGYATFFAGKWHLGNEGSYPEDHGFDINKGGIERGGPYGGNKYFSPYGNPKLEDGPDGELLPARLAQETANFIKENKNKPFLAFLSFYSAHTPLMTTPELEAKYEAKKQAQGREAEWGIEGARKVRLTQDHSVYAGMVESMDSAVGEVLKAIREAGIEENTIIIFTSDNGGLSTSEGHPTSNIPFRAGKGWLYEGGILEPTIVKWPGNINPGTTSSEVITSVDFLATIADIAGLEAPITDGRSSVPVLLGQNPSERSIFWHYPHYGNQGGSPGGAIRKGDFKLIQFFETGAVELYNLAEDPSESMDLSGVHPETTSELLAELKLWQDEVGAQFPTPVAQ